MSENLIDLTPGAQPEVLTDEQKIEQEYAGYYRTRMEDLGKTMPTILEKLTGVTTGNEMAERVTYLFDDFSDIDAYAREAARQAHHREAAYQGANQDHVEQVATDTHKKVSREFWDRFSQDIPNKANFDIIPQPDDVLVELCNEAVKRFPDYDWNRVQSHIFFRELYINWSYDKESNQTAGKLKFEPYIPEANKKEEMPFNIEDFRL